MHWEPTPLPANPPLEICNDPKLTEAYHKVLEFQNSATDSEQMFARVLGYFLLEAPTEKACQVIAADILQCKENKQKLLNCGRQYCAYLIDLCTFQTFVHFIPC